VRDRARDLFARPDDIRGSRGYLWVVPADTDAPADGNERAGRIPFRLRIGVTGHIKLTDSEELRVGVRRAIELAIEQTGYRHAEQRNTDLRLTVVTALAEGADRIVADEVLNFPGRKFPGSMFPTDKFPDSQLISVLPVYEEDIDVYLGDFHDDESRAEFKHWYRDAWRHISPPRGALPPGTSKKAREAGYLWAGLAVVRNCDVLIALWDEEGSRGTGGTADLIERLRKRDKGVSDAERPEETAGPLRVIVPTKGDHTPWVDGGPGSLNAIMPEQNPARRVPGPDC
jgi:hypothetical protein